MPRSILVVDDEDAVRELIVMMLEALGYRVVSAGSEREALDIVLSEAGQSIDLLITDLAMVDVKGEVLAAEILEVLPSLKIIYASGYSDGDPAVEDLDLRKAVFLPKPISAESLANAIQSIFPKPVSGSSIPHLDLAIAPATA